MIVYNLHISINAKMFGIYQIWFPTLLESFFTFHMNEETEEVLYPRIIIQTNLNMTLIGTRIDPTMGG